VCSTQSRKNIAGFLVRCAGASERAMMRGEGNEGSVESFLVWLRGIGMNLMDDEIDIVRDYLVGLQSEHRRGDAARPWFRHAAPRQMMDDHLLIAGLSELMFKENVVALGCNSAMQFRGHGNGSGGGEGVQLLAGRVEEAVLRGWKNRSYGVTLIVPVNLDQSHWGAIFAVSNGPGMEKKGCVYWGDSLGLGSPRKYREAVADFLKGLSQDIVWEVRNENYMTEILKLEVQGDCYSCGFYVISAAMVFADDRGKMPSGSYAKYSAERTEKIRACCARSYIEAVLCVSSGMGDDNRVVRDLHVYNYLSVLLLGEADPLTDIRGASAVITLSSSSDVVMSSSADDGEEANRAAIGTPTGFDATVGGCDNAGKGAGTAGSSKLSLSRRESGKGQPLRILEDEVSRLKDEESVLRRSTPSQSNEKVLSRRKRANPITFFRLRPL